MVTPGPLSGRRGVRDGTSPLHRSIWRLRLPWHRLVLGIALAGTFTAALLLAQRDIERAWAIELVWWMQALELPGRFVVPNFDETSLFTLAVPVIDMRLRYDGLYGVSVHAVVCAIVWVLAGLLSDSAKPAKYLLRFGALLHLTSLFYFAFWPALFPYGLATHVAGGLRQTWALMLIAPWIHLVTYYLFPFAIVKRAALTLLTLVFLFVLAPLQYACHAALLHLLGLTAMPVLYMLFGVMLPILGLVALYGWAMSWEGVETAGASAGAPEPR